MDDLKTHIRSFKDIQNPKLVNNAHQNVVSKKAMMHSCRAGMVYLSRGTKTGNLQVSTDAGLMMSHSISC